jgi:hypothetical protein
MLVRSSIGALAGGAAYAASRVAGNRSHGPRILGIPIQELRPKGGAKRLMPKNLDTRKLLPKNLDAKKMVDSFDLGDLMRRIGDVAEQIEERSEDVHTVSGQAKRLSRKLS